MCCGELMVFLYFFPFSSVCFHQPYVLPYMYCPAAYPMLSNLWALSLSLGSVFGSSENLRGKDGEESRRKYRVKENKKISL